MICKCFKHQHYLEWFLPRFIHRGTCIHKTEVVLKKKAVLTTAASATLA